MPKGKTMHELAKEFPNKTYRELEIYKDADRQEEAQQIPLSESQQSQEDLEPIEKGICIAGEARKDREDSPKEKIKELEEALANALAVNESHQKLNGKLQQRVTDLEEDNKKLVHEIEDRVHKMRKSGL